MLLVDDAKSVAQTYNKQYQKQHRLNVPNDQRICRVHVFNSEDPIKLDKNWPPTTQNTNDIQHH